MPSSRKLWYPAMHTQLTQREGQAPPSRDPSGWLTPRPPVLTRGLPRGPPWWWQWRQQRRHVHESIRPSRLRRTRPNIDVRRKCWWEQRSKILMRGKSLEVRKEGAFGWSKNPQQTDKGLSLKSSTPWQPGCRGSWIWRSDQIKAVFCCLDSLPSFGARSKFGTDLQTPSTDHSPSPPPLTTTQEQNPFSRERRATLLRISFCRFNWTFREQSLQKTFLLCVKQMTCSFSRPKSFPLELLEDYLRSQLHCPRRDSWHSIITGTAVFLTAVSSLLTESFLSHFLAVTISIQQTTKPKMVCATGLQEEEMQWFSLLFCSLNVDASLLFMRRITFTGVSFNGSMQLHCSSRNPAFVQDAGWGAQEFSKSCNFWGQESFSA